MSNHFVHLNLTCSGFAIARGEAKQRELTTRIWKCHLQTSTVVTTQAGQQHHHQQQHWTSSTIWIYTSTFSKSLLSQGLHFAEAKDIKEKCGKWSATLRSNTVPVRCNHWKTIYQKNWSTVPKTLSSGINWNCNKCTKILQHCSLANILSQQLPSLSRDKLIIIQWNADEIRPKLLKLHDRLINSNIDTVVIQVSKLCKAYKTL